MKAAADADNRFPILIPQCGRLAPLAPFLRRLCDELRRALLPPPSRAAVDQYPLDPRVVLEKIAQDQGIALSSLERDQILTLLAEEQAEFGLLQRLVENPQVSDVIVSAFDKIAVQCGRRNYATDYRFADQQSYEQYVEMLLQRAGTSYSTRRPIADGVVRSFARLHVIHRALAESGPYLTIRLNRFQTVKCADLAAGGLAPNEVLAYLCDAAKGGATVLIAGEVGTGKTTLLRAVGSSYPDEESILVIEDTPEIRLEHPHVRYIVTRESNNEGIGLISSHDCIRGGMRMAMNRIVLGEIRDAQAAEAFIDVCSSGHSGLSTIHARSPTEALSRLELFLARAERGVDRSALLQQIATAVSVLVYLGVCPQSGVRRILNVREIGSYADGVIRYREIFRYEPTVMGGCWRIITRSSAYGSSPTAGVALAGLSDRLEDPRHKTNGASAEDGGRC